MAKYMARSSKRMKKYIESEVRSKWKVSIMAGVLVLGVGLSLLVLESALDLNWKTRYWQANKNAFDMFGEPEKKWGKAPEIPLVENMVCETGIGGDNHALVKFDVFAKTDDMRHDELGNLVRKYPKQIASNIRTIVATSAVYNLKDPSLNDIRSQIKRDVEKVIGKGVIDDILIPKWQMNQYY